MGVVQITHEVDLGGTDSLFEELADGHRIEREMTDVLNESARLGAQSAEMYAPTGVTLKLRRHISHERAVPTGTSSWQARAGIEEIPDEEDPERGKYPHTGTGIYGQHKTPVVPTSGRFMVFEWMGRRMVTPSVRGQQPQDFIRDAYRDVNEYLSQRLHLMARRIAARR